VNGVGVSGQIVGSSTAVADISTPLNRSKMSATVNCAFAAGKVLGPAVGGSLIGSVGLAPTFFLSGGCYAATAVCSRFFIEETLPRGSVAMPAGKACSVRKTVRRLLAQWRVLLKKPEMRSLMLLNAFSIAAHSGASMALMPLMLAGDQLALTPLQIGYVFAFMSAVAVCGAPPAAVLADRLGAGCMLAPAVALSAVAMALFPLAGSAEQLVPVLALWGASRSVMNLAPGSLAIGLAAPEARAQTLAMLRTTGDLGFFVGTALVGIAGTALGAGPAMQASGALTGIAAACYAAHRLLRK